ncbi:hypothetical protein QUF70_04170 [Desulfobacterales bacterium HSG17]|nr:hypothetical protein [Desulfobacterales bacterium HSG17]
MASYKKMNRWYSLTNIGCSDSNKIFGKIFAEAEAGEDSPWFSGHFPGAPILPGIAQLALVLDSLQEAFKSNLRIAGLTRVRFRKIIKPGDSLEINVINNKGDAKTYSFKIMIKDEIACAGTLLLK